MEFGNNDGVGDGNGVGDFDGKKGSKRVTTPQLMMVMVMVMVMEFGEVGGSERAPIDCHIVDLAAWLGNGTLRRHMRICATLIMNS